MVPASAVQGKGKQAHVFLVTGERVRRVEVAPGASFGDMREVLGGLKPGDTVVVDPPGGLKDGSKIATEQQ
jgi:multidrug efflux pump subunit AcrA (membrane-fusion protein)